RNTLLWGQFCIRQGLVNGLPCCLKCFLGSGVLISFLHSRPHQEPERTERDGYSRGCPDENRLDEALGEGGGDNRNKRTPGKPSGSCAFCCFRRRERGLSCWRSAFARDSREFR